MLHANFMALCVIELCRPNFYTVGIGILYVFCSRQSCDLDLDLDLDRMTFIYELDSYSLEIYRMCENELPTSRLSKVVV